MSSRPDPAVVAAIGARPAALEHVLAVKMRPVAIAGCDGVRKVRLLAGVEARRLRERRVQGERAIELRAARGLVGHRAPRRGKGRVAGRRDGCKPVGGAALDNEHKAF